mmetsp:Transcript_22485/g.31476  ORF Transcript_22485/g.31476 Transcript_22485/m.31476 type:complete len:219 (-) Transcript_22485:450-1106(-)
MYVYTCIGFYYYFSAINHVPPTFMSLPSEEASPSTVAVPPMASDVVLLVTFPINIVVPSALTMRAAEASLAWIPPVTSCSAVSVLIASPKSGLNLILPLSLSMRTVCISFAFGSLGGRLNTPLTSVMNTARFGCSLEHMASIIVSPLRIVCPSVESKITSPCTNGTYPADRTFSTAARLPSSSMENPLPLASLQVTVLGKGETVIAGTPAFVSLVKSF